MSSELRVIGAEELRARLPDGRRRSTRSRTRSEPSIPTGGPLRTHVETPARFAVADAGRRRGRRRREARLPHAGQPRIGASRCSTRATCLFDAETQAPEAVLDGSALTALRTAAVSGARDPLLEQAGRAASRRLRRGRPGEVAPRGDVCRPPGDRPRGRLQIAGSGRGSRGGGPRPRSHGPRRGPRGGAARRISSAPAPRRRSRCSTDRGSPPGAHVNAVGSYRPETRELDTEAVRRARVVVETREVALAEAGELLIPDPGRRDRRRPRRGRPGRDGSGRRGAALAGRHHALQERRDGVRGPGRRARGRGRGAVTAAGRHGRIVRTVPGEGVEPSRAEAHRFLRPARLPVPPSRPSGL